MTMDAAGTWLAAIGTICMYSFLFKPDNILFEIGQAVFVGFGAAHTVLMGIMNIETTALTPLFKGNVWWLIPICMGIMLYARFLNRYSYFSRWPIGFLMGVGAGVTIKGQLEGGLIKQISSTLLPLTSLDNVIMVIGVVGTIMYFFFFRTSREGVLKYGALVGRWVMMIAFGSSFGNTVMARMSLLAARLQFLFGTWIPIIPKQ